MGKICWGLLAGIPFLVFGVVSFPAYADEKCIPVEEKKVKIEGYISKKFKKNRKKIYQEFIEVGFTRTRLRPFPMGNTSKNFAVGRCVPAYIARHVLKKVLLYTSGVESLVVQEFIPTHWIGVGTTMFDEPSQQKVSQEQVQQLLDPSLTTEDFHALYQKFSVQSVLVPYFGLQVPNAKMKASE